jgi:PAB1-binding protein PBP1
MENIMKRVVLGSTTAIFFMIVLSAIAGAQAQSASLGDYARSVRQNKPQATKAPAKVYDNDNLPSATISVVGGASQTGTDAAKAAGSGLKTDEKSDNKQPEIKPGQSLEERRNVFAAWKTRISDQKKKVDALAHDLDDFQHNSTLAQVSVWPETQKYGQGLADKRKALAQAKADLSDLQEQARKAGVPASVAE